MKYAASALVLLSVVACADQTRPVVDPTTSVQGGVNYERDLVECQSLARQTSPGEQAVRSGAGGAALGAALGAIGGALTGGNIGFAAGMGAAAGAATGAAAGGVSGSAEQEQIVKNCMRNRGYSVLN